MRNTIAILISMSLCSCTVKKSPNENGGTSASPLKSDASPALHGIDVNDYGIVTDPDFKGRTKIDAGLLSVTNTVYAWMNYTPNFHTLFFSFDSVLNPDNLELTPDYGKWKICHGTDCLEARTGLWADEVILPDSMAGHIELWAFACILPERRTTDAECGPGQKIDLIWEVNKDPILVDIQNKIAANVEQRKQLALSVVDDAKKYLAAYPKDGDSSDSQKILLTFAQNITTNPYLIAGFFMTPAWEGIKQDILASDHIPAIATDTSTSTTIAEKASSQGLQLLDKNGAASSLLAIGIIGLIVTHTYTVVKLVRFFSNYNAQAELRTYLADPKLTSIKVTPVGSRFGGWRFVVGTILGGFSIITGAIAGFSNEHKVEVTTADGATHTIQGNIVQNKTTDFFRDIDGYHSYQSGPYQSDPLKQYHDNIEFKSHGWAFWKGMLGQIISITLIVGGVEAAKLNDSPPFSQSLRDRVSSVDQQISTLYDSWKSLMQQRTDLIISANGSQP